MFIDLMTFDLISIKIYREFSNSRTTHSIAFGTQWPMPLHPKPKSSDTFDNGIRSASNRNESKQILSINRNEHAITPKHSNNFTTDLATYISPMPNNQRGTLER